MESLIVSLVLTCLSFVVVRVLARQRPRGRRQPRRRVVIVAGSTQRLGVFGFAQRNVIYDFYQREQSEANVPAVRRLPHRQTGVRAGGQGRATPLILRQPRWRETFKCDALRPIPAKGLPDFGLAEFLD